MWYSSQEHALLVKSIAVGKSRKVAVTYIIIIDIKSNIGLLQFAAFKGCSQDCVLVIS